MHHQALLTLLLPLLVTSSPIDLVKRQFGGFPSFPSPGGGSGGGSGGGFGGFPSFPSPGGGSGGGSGGFPSFPGTGSGGGSSTANDLQSGACKDVTFIFARGTSEPGNVGSVVGPPLINALKQQIGADRVAAQGVNYPASTSGNFPGSNNPGPKNMADFASQAATKCPNTQIVLGGYSQGATVTHNAVSQLAANVVSKVKAITVFGDPLNGQAFKGVPTSNVKNYCASGDSVCRTPTGTGGNGHLSYGGNANDAATFIKGRIQ